MFRYMIVNIIKMNVCRVMIRMWKIVQGIDSVYCVYSGSSVIRMKISLLVYRLLNRCRVREIGLVIRFMFLSSRFIGISRIFRNRLLEENGCRVSLLRKLFIFLIFRL